MSKRAKSSTGTTVARMMITPPIVGVPAFSSCPAKPKCRTVSPICLRRKKRMIFLPNTRAMTSESRKAAAPRKLM